MNKKNEKESFVVVGAGRVGTAMARVLKDAGYRCLALFGRTPEKLKSRSKLVGVEGYTRIKPDITRKADIVFVAVPDDLIQQTSESLVESGAVAESAVLIHFSGLLTSGVLAGGAGGRASAHPNLAFADPVTAAGKIKGTYFGIEGDARGTETAEKIVKDIGGVGVKIPSDGKTAYHLAAVFASNGMVVLASMSSEILESIGVNRQDAEKITSKLMFGTAQNLYELGVLKALTGPVVRGDSRTVSAHLEAMSPLSGDMKKIYCRLFKRMVNLGIEAERGTREKYKPISDLLEKNLLD